MPRTHIHIFLSVGIYYSLSLLLPLEFGIVNVLLLISAELVDLDHLFSKPIYNPRRNSFKTHFLHKNWKILTILASTLLLFYPLSFLGAGILFHFLLDYLDSRYFM